MVPFVGLSWCLAITHAGLSSYSTERYWSMQTQKFLDQNEELRYLVWANPSRFNIGFFRPAVTFALTAIGGFVAVWVLLIITLVVG